MVMVCTERGKEHILSVPKGLMVYQSDRTSRDAKVFTCFVFIWEQTATCATYNINWLVFITEMKSVYSTVWTGSLN